MGGNKFPAWIEIFFLLGRPPETRRAAGESFRRRNLNPRQPATRFNSMSDVVTTPSRPIAPPLRHETTAGNYFVANYPPFAFWKPEFVPQFLDALGKPGTRNAELETQFGQYVHIPFCRKRCHFCYFKVYTDK